MTKPFERPMFDFIRTRFNVAQFINFAVRNLPIPYNLSQEYSLKTSSSVLLRESITPNYREI